MEIIELLLKITGSLMNEVVKKSSGVVRGFVLLTRKRVIISKTIVV